MNMNHIILTIILILPITILGAVEASSSLSQWLDPQNQARHKVGLQPLQWDKKLAQYAQLYGNQRRFDCAMVHSTGPYGENLFWGAGTNWNPAQAVAGWISEGRSYKRQSNSCSIPDCGHYKQIVWRDTRRVGCARVVCASGRGVIFVCEYDPPGDFFGERPY